LRRRAVPERRLVLLAVLLVATSAAFMLIDARGSWSFLLPFRGTRLAALLLVGAAIGIATVMFQTVSGNRILTPSIMGLDALYLLIQSALIFALGGVGYVQIDPRLKFLSVAVLMMMTSALLFGALLGRGRGDLHSILLVGIIFGTMFRSLTNLVQRLIDPNDFAVFQGAAFARFSTVDGQLLFMSAILALIGAGYGWAARHQLDVATLGRETAVSLGVEHHRLTRRTLIAVALLVSATTALVGPVTFFGLLVASLAYVVVPEPRHGLLLPAAGLIGALALVGGQTVFERVMGMASTLSVVVEFAGGLMFLVLLLGRRR
jgi:iron complex transport system permease protein